METVADFDEFVADIERMVERRAEGDAQFLWADEEAKRRITLRSGTVLVEPMDRLPQIRGGLLHVWTGAMFIPEAEAGSVLGVLQDYERHPEIYPEVVSARILEREGQTIRSFLRLRQEQALTVVLNTEHEASFTQVSPQRWTGTSSPCGRRRSKVKPHRWARFWRFPRDSDQATPRGHLGALTALALKQRQYK